MLPTHLLRRSILSRSRLTIQSTQMSTTSETLSDLPVYKSVLSKLNDTFQPQHVEIINESHMHNVPKNSETHFKLVLVSDMFNKKSPIQRHRLVNESLRDELAGPIHALSIIAKTPDQWKQMMIDGKSIKPSPACQGGDGSLPPKHST